MVRVGCERCGDDERSCAAGNGRFDIDSGVRASFGLGRGPSGNSAGRVLLFADEPGEMEANPRMLEVAALPGLLEIVRDSDGAVRQIVAPSCFVDVSGGTGRFEIRFYLPDEKGEKDGLFHEVDPEATPFAAWRVENSGTSDVLNVTEFRKGELKYVNRYSWDYDLSLYRGCGMPAKTERQEIDGLERKAYQSVEVFHPVDPELPGSGKPTRIERPDGRVETFSYEWGTYKTGGLWGLDEWGYDFAPGPLPDNSDVRTTVVEGTMDSPNGAPKKTMHRISISNRTGDVLAEKKEFCSSALEPPSYIYASHMKKECDEYGRPVKVRDHDGSQRQIEWGCCFKDGETDEAGTVWKYVRDSLGRVVAKTLEGGLYPTRYDRVSAYMLDGSGRVLRERVDAGSLRRTSHFYYDMAGRIEKRIDPDGLITRFEYSDDGLTTSVMSPGGERLTVERYADGRPKSVVGAGETDRRYGYGAYDDGTRRVRVRYGTQDAPMWRELVFDMAGRLASVRKPAFGADGEVHATDLEYDRLGRLSAIRPSGAAPFLMEYDDLGRLEASGLDMDFETSPGLDPKSMDQIESRSFTYHQLDGFFEIEEARVLRQANDSGGDAPTIERKRVQGLGYDGLVRHRILADEFGMETVEKTFARPSAKTFEWTAERPGSESPERLVYKNGLLETYEDGVGNAFVYGRDALGRPTSLTDPRTGTWTFRYDEDHRIQRVEDPEGNCESYEYHSSTTGRLAAKIDLLGNAVRYACDERGRLNRIWGEGAEPVEYEYDDLDRPVEIRTFRNGSGWDSETWPEDETGPADVVLLRYDPATGLLVSKEYPDGTKVGYSYTPGGLPSKRILQRSDGSGPLTTTWHRDEKTGEVVLVEYSDDTPGVEIAYDRAGRVETVADATGFRAFAYSDYRSHLLSETLSGLCERTIWRDREWSGDKRGFYKGFRLDDRFETKYGYDKYARPNSVRFEIAASDGSTLADTFDYAYLENSNLIAEMVSTGGLKTSTTWHGRADAVSGIENTFGGKTISKYDCERDALRRIVGIGKSGLAETSAMFRKLAEAERRNTVWATSLPSHSGEADEIPPEQRQYSYDNAGNRVESVEGEDADLAVTSVYETNALDQYERVTEDDGTAARTFELSHDPDGNLALTADGPWRVRCEYDAENRLKSAAPESPAENDVKVEFLYDWLHRRTRKTVSRMVSGSWRVESDRIFVYDGDNAIEEITEKRNEGEPVEPASRYYVRDPRRRRRHRRAARHGRSRVVPAVLSLIRRQRKHGPVDLRQGRNSRPLRIRPLRKRRVPVRPHGRHQSVPLFHQVLRRRNRLRILGKTVLRPVLRSLHQPRPRRRRRRTEPLRLRPKRSGQPGRSQRGIRHPGSHPRDLVGHRTRPVRLRCLRYRKHPAGSLRERQGSSRCRRPVCGRRDPAGKLRMA